MIALHRRWALALAIASPAAAQPAAAPDPAGPTKPAEPAATCGIAAGPVAQIRASVAADVRYRRDGGDALREFFSSEALQAIWTFTLPANPAFPAALCEQVVEGGGAMRIQRQLHCEATKAACAALAAEISQRDDGSGDSE